MGNFSGETLPGVGGQLTVQKMPPRFRMRSFLGQKDSFATHKRSPRQATASQSGGGPRKSAPSHPLLRALFPHLRLVAGAARLRAASAKNSRLRFHSLRLDLQFNLLFLLLPPWSRLSFRYERQWINWHEKSAERSGFRSQTNDITRRMQESRLVLKRDRQERQSASVGRGERGRFSERTRLSPGNHR